MPTGHISQSQRSPPILATTNHKEKTVKTTQKPPSRAADPLVRIKLPHSLVENLDKTRPESTENVSQHIFNLLTALAAKETTNDNSNP